MEILQWGRGDGVAIDYFLKGDFERCNILNGDTFPENVTRYGYGVRIATGDGGGIPTIKKVTSRGFHTGYLIGENGTNADNISGLVIEQCESSFVKVGVDIRQHTLAATLDTCYFEGIEETHIIDLGTATEIFGGIHYVNPTAVSTIIGIDSPLDTKGNSYHGNYIEATNDNSTLIRINGSAGKYCGFNTLIYGGTTKTNAVGVEITGAAPKITGMASNTYNPKGDWLGTGSQKIKKSYTDDMVGDTDAQNGEKSCPLILGAINYALGQATLTEANVAGGTLTIPDDVNVFYFNPTTAVFINTIIASNDGFRPIWLHCNVNVNIDNSAFIKVDGGIRFTGSGSILLHTKAIGANDYSYEVSRTSYI